MKTGKKLGAPLKGLAPRKRVNITIDPEVLQKIDIERRATVKSRGDFIEEMVKHFVVIKDKILITIFMLISLFR